MLSVHRYLTCKKTGLVWPNQSGLSSLCSKVEVFFPDIHFLENIDCPIKKCFFHLIPTMTNTTKPVSLVLSLPMFNE